MLNINIRATFTLSQTGETFIIDSAYARNNNIVVPTITVSTVNISGVTPVINLSIANLPADILTKLSLVDNETNVRIEAGYNNTYKFLAEGAIYFFPEIISNDTDWVWSCDVVPLKNFLDDIEYSQNFETYRTWGYVFDEIFKNTSITVEMAENIRNTTIGAPLSLNVNTFVDLQDYFFSRKWVLTYENGIIRFSDRRTGAVAELSLTPNQIKPNQYLDFQSGRDATLRLAGWVPDITSGMYIDLIDERSVVLFGTTSGFSGTMSIFSSSYVISTVDHPVHELVLRPLTQ